MLRLPAYRAAGAVEATPLTHNRTVPSLLADANSLPSGLYATL
jgi:hypothetical protein